MRLHVICNLRAADKNLGDSGATEVSEALKTDSEVVKLDMGGASCSAEIDVGVEGSRLLLVAVRVQVRRLCSATELCVAFGL